MFQKQPPEVFYKKSNLKNFHKIYRKTGSLFLIKLQVSGLQLKTPTQLFSREFWEYFTNTFCIINTTGWLLLNVCLQVSSFPYQSRRVECRRFHAEYISTWALIRKEFLKALTKRVTKLWTKSIFVSATKVGEKTTNISKLLFFTIDLHFFTSHYFIITSNYDANNKVPK